MRALPRGLRARTTLGFAALGLLSSVALSVATYQLSRWYLLDQRETLATRQVMVDALVARGLVAAARNEDDAVEAALGALPTARVVLRLGDEWFAAVVDLSEESIPEALIADVDEGAAARMRISVNGAPYLLVGVPMQGLDATYYEFVPLREYEGTLRTLGTVLLIGASVTTVGGALAGWFASRRVLRPLAGVSAAARAISTGDLGRRLDVDHDVDLQPVAASFNDMASSLEERIARELRFTSDVSHELRTPLTAMASAVSLARRVELPPRAEFAVTVLDQQVDHLRRLTLELLEISRIDVGVDQLQPDDVDVVEVVLRCVRDAGLSEGIVVDRLGADRIHRLDRARFERTVANLLENADRYAGGATSVSIERSGGDLVVTVDDVGPGVPADERVAIFGRFHRGTAPQPADRPKGTGLGLALVSEHVQMHGGRVWVEDRPGGGARFVVVLPTGEGAT